MGRMLRSQAGSALAGLLLIGCNLTEPTVSPPRVDGRWSGPAKESYRVLDQTGPVAREPTLTLNLTQRGDTLSGTWSIDYHGTALNGAGDLMGSASSAYTCRAGFIGFSCGNQPSGTIIQLTLASDLGVYPTLKVSYAEVSNAKPTEMSGLRYENLNSYYGGPVIAGSATLTKQP